jgi:hypothetical protein
VAARCENFRVKKEIQNIIDVVDNVNYGDHSRHWNSTLRKGSVDYRDIPKWKPESLYK